MRTTLLRGISWNHSRALPPLVATAQRFEEQHGGVKIQWEKRSLHEFGHADIATLARTFDILVIDHPMAGDAEATGVLADLFPLLSKEQIADFKDDSIGSSFASYDYRGKLYALPIDASSPAASLRPDLFTKHDLEEPKLWADVVDLARSGWVQMPGFPSDFFLNFLGLCISRGSTVPASPDQFIDREIGIRCLNDLYELAALMPDDIYSMNPIDLYERMSTGDDVAYCPFAYTYSNYSRRGFSAKHIRFANPVSLEKGLPIHTILGGTGVAISATCKEIELALDYSLFVAGRLCQSTLYGIAGGQPARRSAWHDRLLNKISDDFFLRTALSIESAHVRPRYAGYVSLQERGGEAVAAYCRSRGNAHAALDTVDILYRSSLEGVERFD